MGFLTKALAGAGQAVSAIGMEELKNQSAIKREQRLMELRAKQPVTEDVIKLGPGQKAFRGGKVIAEVAAKPATLQTAEVYDPDSPTGTTIVSREESLGRAGKPGSGMSLEVTPEGGVRLTQGRKEKEEGDGKLKDTISARLGKRATPEKGEGPAGMTNTLAMLDSALKLNEKAPGGYGGPLLQQAGRITGDVFLTEGGEEARDAYTGLEALAETIKAEMIKPTVGGSQISNADVQFVGKATSFNPIMTKKERESRIKQLKDITKRKRDIEVLEIEAAQRGEVFTQDHVRDYYKSIGIDYDTGSKLDKKPLDMFFE